MTGIRMHGDMRFRESRRGRGCDIAMEEQDIDMATHPPWRQLRGKWMVFLVNSHTNATSKR